MYPRTLLALLAAGLLGAFSPAGAGEPAPLLRLGDARRDEGRFRILALAFSPDGKTLASGEADGKRYLSLWDLETGKPRHRLSASFSPLVRSLAFSPDGKTLASGGIHGQ